MIDPDEVCFPNNAIILLDTAVGNIAGVDNHFMRPLRRTDPDTSIGIFGSVWLPDQQSMEMGHQPINEPTLGWYTIGIQAFVKDGDEERGLKKHSVLSTLIRRVLYRSSALHVALAALVVNDGVTVERVGRWRIENQRFLNSEIEGNFLYLSSIEFRLETELTSV